MSWRDEVDPSIKQHLELQIKETRNSEEALKIAENPLNAQLWIAIANLSKQMHEVSLKLNYLEKAFQDINKGRMKGTSKIESKQIKKVMASLTKGNKIK